MLLLNPKQKIDKILVDDDTIESLCEFIEQQSLHFDYKDCYYMAEGYLDGVALRTNPDNSSSTIPMHDDVYNSALELLSYARLHDGTPVYKYFFKENNFPNIKFVDIDPPKISNKN